MKFPRKVEKNFNGCVYQLNLKGVPITTRRPTVRWENKVISSSRLSYHLNVALIDLKPKSQLKGLILHRCNNGPCINPDHLYLGTPTDNFEDRKRAGWSMSQEHKDKISKAQKGPLANNWGKPLTEEVKAKVSLALMGKKRPMRKGKPFRVIVEELGFNFYTVRNRLKRLGIGYRGLNDVESVREVITRELGYSCPKNNK